MKNLGALMKQAQQMQAKMAELQQQLASMEVTGASGGGMVKVTLNGKSEARRVSIDQSLFEEKDREVLEDLILAAFNDARSKAEAANKEKMAELTGGLTLPPGMQLPF